MREAEEQLAGAPRVHGEEVHVLGEGSRKRSEVRCGARRIQGNDYPSSAILSQTTRTGHAPRPCQSSPTVIGSKPGRDSGLREGRSGPERAVQRASNRSAALAASIRSSVHAYAMDAADHKTFPGGVKTSLVEWLADAAVVVLLEATLQSRAEEEKMESVHHGLERRPLSLSLGDLY